MSQEEVVELDVAGFGPEDAAPPARCRLLVILGLGLDDVREVTDPEAPSAERNRLEPLAGCRSGCPEALAWIFCARIAPGAAGVHDGR